jgi:bidirectional [NiFe] hydrogenase diaphorase subunit
LVSLFIDGALIRAVPGTSILWAALDNGFYIPSLCAIREAKPALSACRLCLVEIVGRAGLAASCSEPVAEGLKVLTDTPRVSRARRAAFALIMSNHQVDCAHCPRDTSCSLQEIAQHLKSPLRQKRFRPLTPDFPVDESHPWLRFDRNKCVLCGKCVWVCRRSGKGTIDFAGRGLETRLSLFGGKCFRNLDCEGCETSCAEACPTGALTLKGGAPTRRKAPSYA